MKFKNIVFLFLILFAVSSCEKNIDFTGKVPESLVVVNGIVESDSILSIHISKSKFFLANGNEFASVDNADVSVFVNGVYKEKLAPISGGIYRASFVPSNNDSISYKIFVSGNKVIDCGAKMPSAPVIISIDTIHKQLSAYPTGTYSTKLDGTYVLTDTTGWRLSLEMKVKVKIKDAPLKRNFYQVAPVFVIPKTSNSNNNSTGYIEVTLEGLLSENDADDILDISDSYNYLNIFPDDTFNAKEYVITYTIRGNTIVDVADIDSSYLYLNLRELSADYYNYLNTTQLQSSVDGFFSEQVQVFSNIKNGVGIIGSYSNSDATTKIPFKELLQKADKYSN